MNILYESTVTGSRRHVDKTVSVTTRSNFEMSTEDFSQIDRILQATAWTLIAPNEIQQSDLPDRPADKAIGKMSLSQEMRWNLQILWEQNHEDMEWSEYYDSRMRMMIEMLKQRQR